MFGGDFRIIVKSYFKSIQAMVVILVIYSNNHGKISYLSKLEEVIELDYSFVGLLTSF